MIGVAYFLAIVASLGMLEVLAGWVCVRRFARRPAPQPSALPPITVLKPLHGDEPLLEQALASFCAQDYPTFQIVFGASNDCDPALSIVQRVKARFPGCDIAVVSKPLPAGRNRKVANLINMQQVARHETYLLSDSDMHAPPDFLRRLTATFEQPDTGLVTALYAGLPAGCSLAARLGATWITHRFLPAALIARALGREDCLGGTMLVRRETLARVGGLHALLDHLADDNVLGRLVQNLGLAVRLADIVPATTVPEERLSELVQHELRWARTIGALAPAGFAASVIQFPIAWATLAVVTSGLAPWSLVLFGLTWVARAAAAGGIDRALREWTVKLDFRALIWLLPLRDIISIAVVVVSFFSHRVVWRGEVLNADAGIPARPARSGGEGLVRP
jgi:ceramide glucosyltransferase